MYERVSVLTGVGRVLQDAILRLSGVVTPDQLQDAITDALTLTLTNVVSTAFILHANL